jgi:hypothetical protein
MKSENQILEKVAFSKAQEFFGDENAWRNVIALPNANLVYLATDWKDHTQIGVLAMKDEKLVGIEMPRAMMGCLLIWMYDFAEWSCLAPLTEISLDNGFALAEIPYFTSDGWNKLKTVEFSK